LPPAPPPLILPPDPVPPSGGVPVGPISPVPVPLTDGSVVGGFGEGVSDGGVVGGVPDKLGVFGRPILLPPPNLIIRYSKFL